MPAFLSAPHVRHPVRRLDALRAHPQVAVPIDTEGFPPEVLLLRGVVDVTEVDGLPAEYRASAIPYLGEAEAEAYVDHRSSGQARSCLRRTGSCACRSTTPGLSLPIVSVVDAVESGDPGLTRKDRLRQCPEIARSRDHLCR
jgi:hypothetical protein